MTDQQLNLVIGLPSLTVTALLSLRMGQLTGIRKHTRDLLGDVKSINGKLAEMNANLSKLVKRR